MRRSVGDCTQSVSHDEGVVNPRNDGEGKYGTQAGSAGNCDPSARLKLEQQNKEYCGDLSKRVRFTENARSKVAQARNRIQHRADNQHRDIPAEDQHRKFPGNFVEDGKDQENRAEQQLVSNRVKILSKDGLLFERPRQQPVQAVAEACQYEQDQGCAIVSFHELNYDEGQKDHPHQRKLVRET
jgi:hypothetical protein